MAAPYYSTAGLGFEHLGQATPPAPVQTPTTIQVVQGPSTGPLRILFYVLDMASVGLSAFHGYRRHNGSVGAAIGWGLLGGLFPIVTPAVAFAQGFGKPMPIKSNKRRGKRSYSRSRR